MDQKKVESTDLYLGLKIALDAKLREDINHAFEGVSWLSPSQLGFTPIAHVKILRVMTNVRRGLIKRKVYVLRRMEPWSLRQPH